MAFDFGTKMCRICVSPEAFASITGSFHSLLDESGEKMEIFRAISGFDIPAGEDALVCSKCWPVLMKSYDGFKDLRQHIHKVNSYFKLKNAQLPGQVQNEVSFGTQPKQAPELLPLTTQSPSGSKVIDMEQSFEIEIKPEKFQDDSESEEDCESSTGSFVEKKPRVNLKGFNMEPSINLAEKQHYFPFCGSSFNSLSKNSQVKKMKKAEGTTQGTTVIKYKLAPHLAALLEAKELSKSEVLKKVYAIIKKKNLNDPKDGHFAFSDSALKKFIGVKRFRTFGMMKYFWRHMKPINSQ